MKHKIRESIWYKRFKSKIPDFWKKVRTKALWLGGSALASIGAAVAVNQIVGYEVIDKTLILILGYIVTACAFVAGTATFTTSDQKLSDK